MQVEEFAELFKELNIDFFVGVPDSLLRPLSDYLTTNCGTDKHVISANEGNAVGLAAGHFLATKRPALVYMQNSGIGNAINPIVSLLHPKVYGIPCVFVVGWRGEPATKDEPQHVFQGEITQQLLNDVGVTCFLVDKGSNWDLKTKINQYREALVTGKSIAFVVKSGALQNQQIVNYKNQYSMVREHVIEHIVEFAYDSVLVSTTGKISRELFEIRKKKQQSHDHDFLTVGSMGHCSSIALGVALKKPQQRVCCIDGDGAVLMHMGAMAVIGSLKPHNMVHIVINNEAHETVGGMPTVANGINLPQIAKACGYQLIESVDNYPDLDRALNKAVSSDVLAFLEIRTALGSRKDLGRPTTLPKEIKDDLMNVLGCGNLMR
ncbi:MAG: phosphonopyruvate decarboxylase [Oscillospiraceae bacterium]|jgi:phosphonopyruvate decarboxylase|nr:phosphonopyruvate decarboxylase [Oscillospiraceae bacterium]